MPRGNRKASLASRLADIQPRGIVSPSEIPGTKTWWFLRNEASSNVPYNAEDARENFFTNFSVEDLANYAQLIPRAFSMGKATQNENLIDNINRWVDSTGWQYIDGGEFNGSWVNPQYPNKIFSGTSCCLPVSGGATETVEFPVASHEDDPRGLACHFEVSVAGIKSTIKPNKWTNYDSTRKGRLQARNNKKAAIRFKRWEAYEEANQIKDPMKRKNAIHTLKAQFRSENISKERAEMGYDDELDAGLDM